MKTRKQNISDRLYIQEIINDLRDRGLEHTKAWRMLKDWSAELRHKSGLTGKTKKTFYKQTGKNLWNTQK